MTHPQMHICFIQSYTLLIPLRFNPIGNVLEKGHEQREYKTGIEIYPER